MNAVLVTELINTGSELMLGRVLNTHQQWLCRELADRGYVVSRQVAVPDTAAAIAQAVRESLARADLLLVTGGLGPTSDDLTRDVLAQLVGRRLLEDAGVLEHLREYFARLGRVMPERTRVQAQVPEGATVLPNACGTAPGLALTLRPNPFRPGAEPSLLVLLPGPPRELRPMFSAQVAPLLQRELAAAPQFVCRTFRTTGLGESLVEERVGGRLLPLVERGLELGYCARPGQVDVRLAAQGPAAETLVCQAEAIVRSQLGQFLYGLQDEELEAAVLALLAGRGATLALAESCTGGCIAHRLTNVPGASAVFLAGLVTYSNAAKEKFLSVRSATLAEHGAVSEAVAREMAEGARRAAGSDYALSVTGIAGPGGGTAAKPVGTVFMGLAGAFPTIVEHHLNACDRETFKQVTTHQALELLRRKLKE